MKTKIIKQQGEAALVEYRDESGVHRVTIPAARAMGDILTIVLEQGIPYGEAWEQVLSSTTAEQKARALRERGIWTAQDLRANVKQARAALQDLIATDLAALLDSLREVQK